MAGPSWQETADHRSETGSFGPGPGLGRFQDGRSRNGDSLWMAVQAVQVLSLADGQATQLAEEAQVDAAAIREAAEREAAAITQQATAIREAAVRDAAELRAQLSSMLAEVSRVAAYLTETFGAPAMLPIAPTVPDARPTPTGATSALPATLPMPPDTIRPARPAAKPARPATSKPGRPATKPGRPSVRPATKSAGRQAKAMRKFTAAFAIASVLGAAVGGAELALHGYSFFIFRANGAGGTVTGPREPAVPPRPGVPFPFTPPLAHHHTAAHHQPTRTNSTK